LGNGGNGGGKGEDETPEVRPEAHQEARQEARPEAARPQPARERRAPRRAGGGSGALPLPDALPAGGPPEEPAGEPAGPPGGSRNAFKGDEPPPPPPWEDDGRGPCPVRPLGTHKGVFFFFTPMQQFRAVPARALANAGEVAGLFENRIAWLEQAFPRYSRDGSAVPGWNAAKARDFLVGEAARAGLFDPATRIVESGCWRMPGGALLVHLGEKVLRFDRAGHWPEAYAPGVHGGYVFPAGKALLEPALLEPASAAFGRSLREGFKRWNLERPELDSLTLLGFLACAHYAGALDARPHGWIVGDTRQGKSTLRELFHAALRDLMEATSDVTAAGVRNLVAGRSLCVALDELENDPEAQRRNAEMVKTLRLAWMRGQGAIVRSDPSQAVKQSHIDAIFLAQSVHPPGLLPQDRNRVTVWHLGRLEEGGDQAGRIALLNELIAAVRRAAPALRARLFLGWGRFLDEEARAREALLAAGGDARFAAHYGALLAGAAVLLHDRAGEAELEAWALTVAKGTRADKAEEGGGDAENFMRRTLGATVETWRGGERAQVGELIGNCLAGGGAPERHADNRVLRRHGIALVREKALGRDGVERDWLWLAVANAHEGLERIFAGTAWQARAGTEGPWRTSMKRFEHVLVPDKPYSFGGVKKRAVLVLVDEIRGLIGGDGEGGEA
jgi:hypothetical protein